MQKALIAILIILILGGVGYFVYTKGLIKLDFWEKGDESIVKVEDVKIESNEESKLISDLKFIPHNYSIDLIKGNFATGVANDAHYIAMKKDGNWSILVSFQDDPSCKTLKENNVPTEIYGGPCHDYDSRWFEPVILNFKNNVKVTLKETGPTVINEYYSKEEVSAIAKNSTYAKRDSKGLHLKLADGSSKLITDNYEENYSKYRKNVFEYFFKDFGFYSVQVGYYEGGVYDLINYFTGKETTLVGRPYFSQNGKYVLSVNSDLEAGYNPNGFELYENNNGTLELLGKYEPREWGPTSVKWIDDTTAIMRVNTMEVVQGQMKDFESYVELKIIK